MSVEFGTADELSECLSSGKASTFSSVFLRVLTENFANSRITTDEEATKKLRNAFRQAKYVRDVTNISQAEKDVSNIVSDALLECSRKQ